MTPFIWRDRRVEMSDGYFHLSAKGRHEDFNYLSDTDDCAMCGNPGFPVTDIEYLDEDELIIHSTGGEFRLCGDDFTGKTDTPAVLERRK